MSREYWEEVRRLSKENEDASSALKAFLEETPSPRTDEELEAYDAVHDAALEAFRAYAQYCQENSHRR